MPTWYLHNSLTTLSQILEYSLFQPGLILNYFAPAGETTKHFAHLELPIDFLNRRAIILKGEDSLVTLTTVNDIANVIARAIEYDGEWPVIGGIQGTTILTSKLLEIGVKARGMETFSI